MAENVYILLGFGGSGLKTLTRVNKLLSEDTAWRSRMGRQIYYLIVDTDVNDIRNFKSSIAAHANGVSEANVYELVLSQNVNTLSDIVNRYIIDEYFGKEDDPGLARIKDHWWFSNKGVPFKGEMTQNVQDGASQCPPVSFFLAWEKLEKVAEIYKKMRRDITAKFGQLRTGQLRFYVTAGLSGGTGRGSWEIITLRLRQLLQKEQLDDMPLGFFFDSSTNPELLERHPDWRPKMMANSLTGFSQLSTWILNFQQVTGGRFEYRLPRLTAPGDKELDVLNVNVERDGLACSPVGNAYLFFQRNDIKLARNSDFYDMVGSGIYANIVNPEVSSRGCNDGRGTFRSMGVATIEVDAASLQKAYEEKAQLMVLGKLFTENLEESVDRAEDFIRRARLAPMQEGVQGDGSLANPKGSLLQRALAHALSECEKQDWGQLEKLLQLDDKEASINKAKSFAEPSQSRCQKAIAAAIKSITTEQPPEGYRSNDLDSLLDWLVTDAYNRSGSLRFVENILMAVMTHLDEFYDKPLDLIQPVKDLPAEMVDRLSGYFISKPPFISKRRFDQWEIDDINSFCRNYFEYQYVEAIAKGLKNEVVEPLREKLKKRAAFINKFIDKTKSMIRTMGKGDHGAMFMDPNDPVVLRAGDIAERYVRRVLRPAMSAEETRSLLQDVQIKKPLKELLMEVATHEEATSEKAMKDEVEKKARKMRKLLETEVHLPEGFLEKNFSLNQIVDQHRRACEAKLNRLRGSRDQLNEFANDLFQAYGVEYTSEEDRLVLPESEEFLLRMAARLAGSVAPYWQLSGRKESFTDNVTLFLPGTGNKSTSLKFIEDSGLIPPGTQIWCDYDNSAKTNQSQGGGIKSCPFRIIAISNAATKNPDRIRSLDYWRDDAMVRKILDAAETPSGDSIFDMKYSDTGGLGYNDPMYVRDPNIRSLRWRPWVKNEAGSEVVELLAYLFLEAPQDLQDGFDRLGWSMPLVKCQEQRRYRFTRPWHTLDGKVAETTEAGSPWKPNEILDQSLERVRACLMGQPTSHRNVKEQTSKIRSGILAEKNIFQEHVRTVLGLTNGSDQYRNFIRHNRKLFEGYATKAEPEEKGVWLEIIDYLRREENG